MGEVIGVLALIVGVPLLFVGFAFLYTWIFRQREILMLIAFILAVFGTITIVKSLYQARKWWTWKNAMPVLVWVVGLAVLIVCARLFMPWNPNYRHMLLVILFILDVCGLLGIAAFLSGRWKS